MTNLLKISVSPSPIIILKNGFFSSAFFLFTCFFLVFISGGNAQTGIQTFKSSKIKINNYGTREQTSTISPNIITLDLSDSLITVQPDHEGINEFLGHQNQFEFSQSYTTGPFTRVYLTSSEYVFIFDSQMRAIIISKREISPSIHSVWFQEISSPF